MRQDFRDEVRAFGKAALGFWAWMTLAVMCFWVPGVLFLEFHPPDLPNSMDAGASPELVSQVGSFLWTFLAFPIVASALLTVVFMLPVFGAELKARPHGLLQVFRVRLGMRVFLTLPGLVLGWTFLFGVHDSISAAFLPSNILWTIGGGVLPCLVSVSTWQQQVAVSETSVWIQPGIGRRRCYLREEIEWMERRLDEIYLHLRTGKSIKLPGHLERPGELTEMLENMLNARG